MIDQTDVSTNIWLAGNARPPASNRFETPFGAAERRQSARILARDQRLQPCVQHGGFFPADRLTLAPWLEASSSMISVVLICINMAY